MTHETSPKCPDCGSEMRWKYLEKPHCQACNHTRGLATQTDPAAEGIIETHPHTPKPGRENRKFTEDEKAELRRSSEDPLHELDDRTELNRATGKYRNRSATRYVYHINGHARLHNPDPGAHTHGGAPNAPAVPFEVVIRKPFAITSDSDMDEARDEVRNHIITELERQGSPYIVGDVMIRGVSKLHRILVDANDLEGPATRIFS